MKYEKLLRLKQIYMKDERIKSLSEEYDSIIQDEIEWFKKQIINYTFEHPINQYNTYYYTDRDRIVYLIEELKELTKEVDNMEKLKE